jgi:hypothetical protein
MPLKKIEDTAKQLQARQQQRSGIAQKEDTPRPNVPGMRGSPKREGGRKSDEPKSPSARRDERKAQQREQKIMLKEYGMKKGGLKGNQKKLDKNNNNRIDSEDFKILRGGRAAMKAKKGKLVPLKSDPTKAISSVKPSAGGKGGPPKKTPKQARSAVEDFIKRRKKLSGIGRGGRIGAAAALLGLAGAGAAKLGQTIGRKIDEAKKKNKKMGGGMMKKYSKGGDSKLQKGIEGTTFKPKKQTFGIFGDSKQFQKKYYDMTSAAKRDAHKKGRSEGKKFRGMTFVDRKTGTLRLDTVSNRKKYGKRVYKAPDVSYVEPRKLSKGGGADTGTAGERRSKLMTAVDRFKRRVRVRKRRPDYIKPPERKSMIPAGVGEIAQSLTPTGIGKQMGRKVMGKMGGGMIGKPMGYKSGTSVKVKCKLGRNKPTKMY